MICMNLTPGLFTLIFRNRMSKQRGQQLAFIWDARDYLGPFESTGSSIPGSTGCLFTDKASAAKRCDNVIMTEVFVQLQDSRRFSSLPGRSRYIVRVFFTYRIRLVVLVSFQLLMLDGLAQQALGSTRSPLACCLGQK